MIIYLLFAALFFAIFMILRFGQTRFSPVRIWIFMWMISFVAHALFGGVYYFSPMMTAVVATGVITYVLGALLFWASRPSIEPKLPENNRKFADFMGSSRIMSWLTSLAIFMVLPFIERGFRAYTGGTLLSFFSSSASRIMSMMRENHSALSQANELNFPTDFKIATMIIVCLSVIIFYRLSFGRPSLHDTINVFMMVLVSIIFSAVTSVRSILLIPMIIGAFSFFAGCVINNRTHILTSKKTILGSLFILVTFSIWVVIVQSARLGDISIERIGATLSHLRPWVAGYIPALSVWTESNSGYQPAWGSFFLGGVLGPLGLGSGEGFDTRLGHADIGNWQKSNAMTIFRIFILDFGLIGAFIFPFFLGWLGEFYFQRALKYGGAWIPILIAQYCWTFFSINYWFFFYGSRVFGFLAIILVFAFITHIKKSPKKLH